MNAFGFTVLFSLAAAVPAFACSPPIVSNTDFLLVGNKGENTVSFINLETGRESGRAAVSGSSPHEIAVTPDGQFAAVVNYGDATIDIFTVGRQSILKTINLEENKNPHGLVALRNGGFLATTEGGQSIVQLTPNHGYPGVAIRECLQHDWTVKSISTGEEGTHMVALSPDESIAYTSNMFSGTVSRIDLQTEDVKSVPAGIQVEGIAVTRDGGEVWASVRGEDKVIIYDAASMDQLAEIPVGAFPLRILLSPDGTKMITSNFIDGTVSVIDVETRTVERTINVSGSSNSQQVTLLFSDDGTRLYVAETGVNKIAEIDFASGKLIRRLSAGVQGDGLAIVPSFGSVE